MRTGTAVTYRVFVRDWWRRKTGYSGPLRAGDYSTLEPNPGARKRTIAQGCTYDEAREIAQEWNASHSPGPLSRKAEFDEE